MIAADSGPEEATEQEKEKEQELEQEQEKSQDKDMVSAIVLDDATNTDNTLAASDAVDNSNSSGTVCTNTSRLE